MKYLVFDMDGTIADLYSVDNWLDKLRAEDATPYMVAEPLVDMDKFLDTLYELQQVHDYKIVINSWLSKESTAEYDELVRDAKLGWLALQDFDFADHIHIIKYGTTKAKPMSKYFKKGDTAILFDDNAKVRKGWTLGDTVDPTVTDIIEYLVGLL